MFLFLNIVLTQKIIIFISYFTFVQITTCRGSPLHSFEVGHKSNCVTPTPENYGSSSIHGFNSLLIVGGESVSSYAPENGISENPAKLLHIDDQIIWSLKYTSNGSLLYAGCEGGKVKRLRRYPNDHKFLDDVIFHKSDVYDLDISLYDEFLVTASKDKSVGILNLGSPSHGWTGYFELT